MNGKALNANMLYYLFDSTNMHRWNDHLRTLDLSEMDKQAHKTAIAWVLGKCEEDAGAAIDWHRLIEHNLFSFIQRIALTDLKPQVFHRIEEEKADDVSRYVLCEFDRSVPHTDEGFRKRFEEYLYSDRSSKEDAVIRAAHYLATKWEFDTIYEVNRSVYGIEDTKKEIDGQIGQHSDLAGVRDLMTKRSDLDNFIDIVGQLRFQQRWARTPRIPKTTVLGHSLLVADMVYLNDCDCGVEGEQVYNDFYTALFHDLPEVLTKDVITPVKTSVSGLPDLLEGIEHEMMEKRIMPLIPAGWREELRFMAYDPFSDSDLPRRNGKEIKACDWLAAWMEAHISICYGVSSKSLRDGKVDIGRKLTAVGGYGETIDAFDIMADFEKMEI
ncbi:YfbR-like 5'-deoxynucleotidase [Methanomethylophilus alvi]|uniref:YfbR-like 5'-deoxynucleotidase n=1 Tax=Methanomethylophilus alvi TaxID=1291540 RepID=UPI0037DD61B3